MADPTDLNELPQATVVPRKRLRLSVVWVIPIVAAVVTIWIGFKRIQSEGSTITIVFNAADGIEAGKTAVKYKDVKIGQVTVVQLTQDYRKVEVKAKIARSAAGLMVEDAKLWIVEPRVTRSGISGLGALLSGNYIGIQPGKSNKSQRRFIGLDAPPVITDRPGRQFVLKAEELGWSSGIGSPVYYRSLPVGQIVTYGLASDGKAVEIAVFVNAPYDRYVTPATRFWNASGVSVSVGANGVDARAESFAALLAGGVAFDTPPRVRQPEPAAEKTVFVLYDDRATAMKAPDPDARHYVLYFRQSVRGLTAGAPVTILGLPAGEVTSVDLALDAATAKLRPRVVITFNPVAGAVDQSGRKRPALLRRMVEERSLRGQLKSGSLLTGKLFVEFDYFPKAPRVKLDLSQALPELPVVPSGLVDIEAKVNSILDKLDELPLASIGSDLKNNLEAIEPTLKEIRKLLPQLSLDVHGALQEIAGAARSLRVLTDYLERHPESLLRGKRDGTSGAK
jgi:paraquat-inducible protein B